MTKRIRSKILDEICEVDDNGAVFESGVVYTRRELDAIKERQSRDPDAHAENVRAIHKVKKHFNGELLPGGPSHV